MAQKTVPVSQIEEVARRVVGEQAEGLRQELLQEMAARVPHRSELEERVWEAIHELAQAQTRTEKRVEELAQAQARTEKRVEELAQAQARTEKRVEELAQAQARTEKRVEELAQAQARTEERLTRLEATVEKLAQAQARTEERLTRLEATVEKLAQAQARTEKRVEELAQAQIRTEERLTRLEATVERLAVAQERMAWQLGALSNLLGADLEVDAEETLGYVMRQKGYRQIGPAYPMDVDGEIDVAVLLESQTGERIWALVEVKARTRKHEVEKWGQRFRDPTFLRRLAEARIEKPYLPYVFGLRVYPDAVSTAEEMGIGVLDPRGEKVAAVALS